MRIVLGITGASGATYALAFLKRLGDHDAYVVLTRWGRSLLRSEAGASPEDLAACARKVYATDDLSCPLASGSNPFDAMVVLPCSVGTLGKIAGGISDTLLTRTAEVALKEGRRLILCVRETPLSAVALENALKLARLGVTIMPVSPPFYMKPRSLEELTDRFAEKVLSTLGLPVGAGWRAAELE